jgi:tetratricopeptide (TPR) repeat protein
VATGVTADRHGILDFLVRDPATGEQVPTNSRFRKVRALWNQFTEAGRSVDFVAWWATWPAEPVNGHMISDRVSYSLFDVDMPSGGAGATYPPEYFDEIRPRLVGDDAITYEEVRRFADVTREQFDAARARIGRDRKSAYREPINHLTKILASTRNYHRIALDLISGGQADLTAVYYQGIDEVCHRFMHFAAPRLDGIAAEDVARYGKVVERFYAYQDELLGELLRAVDDDTAVVLLSDHGFVNGPDRPAGETADIEGKPGRWHRPYGVLVLAGPPIRATKLDTTSLLDIAPTVLYLSGLPLPEDGEGRLLTEAIRPGFASRVAVNTIPTYDVTPIRIEATVGSAEMAAAEAEMLENLRSLGYIGGGSQPSGEAGDASAAAPDTEAESLLTAHLNLAGVHLSEGRLAEAEAEVRQALAQAPDYPPAHGTLFNVLLRQGRRDEAIEVARWLLDHGEPGSATFLARVADTYLQAGRAEEGIRLFRARVDAGGRRFGNPLSRLLLETGDVAGAAREARLVLAQDPLDEGAMSIAFRAAQAGGGGGLDPLEPAVRRALEVNPRSVMHLNWMGVILESRGDVPGAEGYLRRALEADPDHGPSMANLGAFYARNGRAEEALPLLRRALRIDPGNVMARVNLASALAYLERYDEAIEQFEQVVEAGARSTAIYNALARANRERGDLRAAVDWLRRSLELDPDQAEMRAVLSRLEAEI